MKSALIIAVAFVLMASSAQSHQPDGMPMHEWPICTEGDTTPECLDFVGDPISVKINKENCENGKLYEGTRYACHIIPEPMSAEELRAMFPEDGRTIIGLTFPEEKAVEEASCDTAFCSGPFTPWTESHWHRNNHDRSDQDRADRNRDVADRATTQPDEQPEQSRPDPEPAPTEPPNCPGGTD